MSSLTGGDVAHHSNATNEGTATEQARSPAELRVGMFFEYFISSVLFNSIEFVSFCR